MQLIEAEQPVNQYDRGMQIQNIHTYNRVKRISNS